MIASVKPEDLIPLIFGLTSSIVSIIAGFGLGRAKLWGLYAFLALTGIHLMYLMYYLSLNPPFATLSIIVGVIYVLFSVWFYSAKDRFKK